MTGAYLVTRRQMKGPYLAARKHYDRCLPCYPWPNERSLPCYTVNTMTGPKLFACV
jgi:hypothetical protein